MNTELEQLKEQLAQMSIRVKELEEKGTTEHTPAYEAMLPSIGGCLLGERFQPVEIGWEVQALPEDQNVFPDKETTQGYANAFSIMLELRRCKGAGHYNEDSRGFYYDINEGYIDWQGYEDTPYFSFFPPFPTHDLAQAALEAVGEERIEKAMKFLANVKD